MLLNSGDDVPEEVMKEVQRLRGGDLNMIEFSSSVELHL